MYIEHLSRNFWVIFLFFLLTLPVANFAASENNKIIEPSMTLMGNDSLIDKPCFLRITTLQEWLWLWLQHKPSVYKLDKSESQSQRAALVSGLEHLAISGIPHVDFDKYMVIAIFTGEQPDVSGLNATIAETEEEIKCTYSLTKKTESNARQARNGYGFFIIPQIDKSLTFLEQNPDRSITERKRLGMLKSDGAPKSFYSPDDLGLKEFLFKYQLKQLLIFQIESLFRDPDIAMPIFFIDMDRTKDPSDEFMERFSGFGFMIKKFSESTGYAMRGVKDRETQQDGIIIYVRILRWLDNQKAEVEYGYYMHGLGAQNTIRIVESKDDNWLLGKIISGWMS